MLEIAISLIQNLEIRSIPWKTAYSTEIYFPPGRRPLRLVLKLDINFHPPGSKIYQKEDPDREIGSHPTDGDRPTLMWKSCLPLDAKY